MRVPLRDEGDDRRGGETDWRPAGQFGRQQVGETTPDAAKARLAKRISMRASVRTVGGFGEPDQRSDGDVVQRRVVGDPHGAIAAVTAGRSLDLLHGAVWHSWLALDLGQPEVGDLVGVPEVGLLVGVVERRMLEANIAVMPTKAMTTPTRPITARVHPAPSRRRHDGASLAVVGRDSVRVVSPSRRPARRP